MKKFLSIFVFALLASLYGYGQGKAYDLRYNAYFVDDVSLKRIDTVQMGETYIYKVIISNYGPNSFSGFISFRSGVNPKHENPPFADSDTSRTFEKLNFTGNNIIPVGATAVVFLKFKIGIDNFKYSDTSAIVITWPNDGVTNHDTLPGNDFAVTKVYVKSDPNGVITSIKESKSPAMGIYPNPAQDNAVVTLTNITQEGTLTLKDVTGKTIETVRIRPAAYQKLQLDLEKDGAQLPHGIYFLDFIAGNKHEVSKLIIAQ